MNRKLLILFESNVEGRSWKGERVSELLDSLSQYGWDVQYVGLRGRREPAKIILGSGRATLTAIPASTAAALARFGRMLGVTVKQRTVRNILSQAIFLCALLLHRRRIVFTQSTLGIVAALAKRLGHTVIVECDMTWPSKWEQVIADEQRRLATAGVGSDAPTKWRTLNDNLAFRHADRIVFFSDWAAEGENDSGKVAVIQPVSLPAQPLPIAGRRHGDLPLRLIFVGQLSFRKGFHILIDALHKVAQDRRIACDVYGAMQPSMTTFLRASGRELPSGVNLHGQANWQNDAPLDRYRYIAVLPSLVEGSPRYAFEASALGIPSIVSAAAKPSFLHHAHQCLLLPRTHSEDLAAAIEEFFVHPGLWANLSTSTVHAYAGAGRNSYGQEIIHLLTSLDANDARQSSRAIGG